MPGNCSAEAFDLVYSSEAQANVISPDQEFHGYHLRDPQALDVWTTWALIQLLNSPDTYYLDGMACVEPGMGLRIHWGSKCKDFLAQLNCLHVSVYDEDGRERRLDLSMTGRWALVALYNDLFPRHRIEVWSKE